MIPSFVTASLIVSLSLFASECWNDQLSISRRTELHQLGDRLSRSRVSSHSLLLVVHLFFSSLDDIRKNWVNPTKAKSTEISLGNASSRSSKRCPNSGRSSLPVNARGTLAQETGGIQGETESSRRCSRYCSEETRGRQDSLSLAFSSSLSSGARGKSEQ